jgi:L-glutamine-phosphate cytidylyltransferase
MSYEVRVRECSFDDIIEIDTYRELQELDPAYAV